MTLRFLWPRVRRVVPPALLVALAGLAAAALTASAETGAPVQDVDGVWRSPGNWRVQAGDDVFHGNKSIEISGNLTIESNATLRLLNVSLTFPSGSPAPRTLSVEPGAFLFMERVNLQMREAGDRLRVRAGTCTAEGSTLLFEGQAGQPYSLLVQGGWLGLTDSAVITDAAVGMDARDSEVGTLDSQFTNEPGAASPILVAGPGNYTFDTTGFGTLLVEAGPSVFLYSTVRFYLQSLEGDLLNGTVTGTGAYGEVFSANARTDGSASLRLKGLELRPAQQNLTAAERRSPAPVRITAVAAGVGANTSEVFLDAPRVNATLVLDRTFELGVTALTVAGSMLEGQGNRRAYYVEINATQEVRLRIQNLGYAASPATTLSVFRVALDAVAWLPYAEEPLSPMAVPPLGIGESVNLTFHVVPGTYGGFLDNSEGCVASIRYVSAVSVRIDQARAGDFRRSNDEAEAKLVAYDVRHREGPGCEPPSTDILVLLAEAGAVAAAAAIGLSWWFSEARVVKRAARRQESKRPPP